MMLNNLYLPAHSFKQQHISVLRQYLPIFTVVYRNNMLINIMSFKALRVVNTNVCIHQLFRTFFFRYVLINLINFVGIRNTIGLP